MRKIKIKCFHCEAKFGNKQEIFRDLNGYPVCKYCLEEMLYDYWEDDFIESIMDEIEQKFNRNYKKWKKWFYENHEICDGMHDNEFYYPKKDMTEIDGNKYCPACIDNLFEKGE